MCTRRQAPVLYSTLWLPADADPDAGAVCALLRVPEYDRVPGSSFIWLADISIKDPFFILPVLMGISMYLLSWIGSEKCAAESTGEDDELHVPGDDDVRAGEHGLRAEPLLYSTEHGRTSSAMVSG